MSHNVRDHGQVLIAFAEAHESDDLAIAREGWRRSERELRAAVGFAKHAIADASPDMLARSVERLGAVADLHRLLRSPSAYIQLHDAVPDLCVALIRSAEIPCAPTTKVEVAFGAVGGSLAAAVLLTVAALIAGDGPGGPVLTGGEVELEVHLDPVRVSIVLRDLASDPPDREAVGGPLLRRILAATGGTCERWESPGLATVRVELPAADAMPLRTVGNA